LAEYEAASETNFATVRDIALSFLYLGRKGLDGDRGALAFLCGQLSSALASSEEQNNSQGSISYRWRPAIESHEQNNVRGPHEVENLLVSAVRNAAEQVIREQKASVQETAALLESQPFPVFHRLTLHTLRTFASDAPEPVADYLSRRAEFDSLDSHHEYALLIQECSTLLPPYIPIDYP
jgi:hypothetical protein